MEEKELLSRIKNDNDDVAFRELLKSCEKMIQSIINSFELEYGDFRISRDDMFQEGMIALHEACKSYEECFGAKFSTFAYTVIKRRLHHFYYHNKKRYQAEIYSIDAIDIQDHFSPLADYVSDNSFIYLQEERKDKINKILSKLRDEDRTILEMRINSYSYEEIAKHLNINKKRVDNRLVRIRQRLMRNNLQW